MKTIQLKTNEKLMIRKPCESDAVQIIDYLNRVGGESDNLLHGKNEFNLTVDQEKEYIKNINQNPNSYMILGIVNEEIASIAAIHRKNKKRIAHNSELAISVRKDYWAIGIGSAMINELITFARDNNIKNISLGVKADNIKGIKLYEKFGFKPIGIHKDYFNINGKYADEMIMDLSI